MRSCFFPCREIKKGPEEKLPPAPSYFLLRKRGSTISLRLQNDYRGSVAVKLGIVIERCIVRVFRVSNISQGKGYAGSVLLDIVFCHAALAGTIRRAGR